jgi:hypothetical protein
MSYGFLDIAMTPSVRAVQAKMGAEAGRPPAREYGFPRRRQLNVTPVGALDVRPLHG